MRRLSVGTLLLSLMLTGCGQQQDSAQSADAKQGISTARLARHIETLASDEYEGRAPATEGEKKTVGYIGEQYARIGLEAAADGYLQPVPLVETTPRDITALSITGGAEPLSFALMDDMMATTRRVAARAEVKDSDIIFVGYGIVAPEYGWDDYQAVDVAGKTVIVLVNDPGFASGDPTLFNGRAMTYYGRWTYKYEEAARHGASAVLIVHETEAASYPWAVVQSGWSGSQLDLARDQGQGDRAAIEGWLQLAAATKLFAAAGQDYPALAAAAGTKGFQAVPLGLQASLAMDVDIGYRHSYNVAGLLKGSERPDEVVIYAAHWDHLGRGPMVDGDDIYNGAVDNASGIAALLEIADAFASGPRPARSLLFLAVTAEESGLLGSDYYVEHPIFAAKDTVAAINMDSLGVFGPTHDMVLVGKGKSELEPMFEAVLKGQGRELRDEPHPERGYYYRSDHFNFAKAGVPALYVDPGIENVEHGKAWGEAAANAYNDQHYHTPSDEFDPNWDLSGMARDAEALYEMGRRLATSDAWPNFMPGTEFRAKRDQLRSNDSNLGAEGPPQP